MSVNIEYSSSFVFTGNRGTKAGRAVNKLKIRTKKEVKYTKVPINNNNNNKKKTSNS